MVSAMAPREYDVVVAKLKAAGRTDLVKYWIYHPYIADPDNAVDGWFGYDFIDGLRHRLVAVNPDWRIMQGEAGCPAQLEFDHALHDHTWSEYSQAKWHLRRMAGEAARGIPYNAFTIIDLQYPWMLQSFGLIRADANHRFVYRRPSYWAVQHMMTFFDSEVESIGPVAARCCPASRPVTVLRFVKRGLPVLLVWNSGRVPGDRIAWDRVVLTVPGVTFREPVWVEMITGRIFAIDPLDFTVKDGATSFHDLPLWDCPVMIAERAAVPLVVSPGE